MPPKTHEQTLLRDAEAVLASAAGAFRSNVTRLEVLEGAASILGGWSLDHYWKLFCADAISEANSEETIQHAKALLLQLDRLPFPAPVALAALGHTAQSRHHQRTRGVFYTDFRLASFVADLVASELKPTSRIVDLAAGSGILLVASVLAASRRDRAEATRLVAEAICAADLDALALRACRASLASVCDDLEAISQLEGRLRRQDSLIAGLAGWSDVAPDGFDLVVGNPPWEKLKVSRHEFIRANGRDRHYGDDYALDSIDHEGLTNARSRQAAYAIAVENLYPIAGHGELDFYKAFAACSLSVLREEGTCCLVLPAGLIRSQGTRALRVELFRKCSSLRFTVIENRARFFSIDSRFKFLVLKARTGDVLEPIELSVGRGRTVDVQITRSAKMARATLRNVRPDLTIPEVAGTEEWHLVVAMHERGIPMDAPASPFQTRIVREVDMTQDRAHFSAVQGEGYLPLAEGRMIAQHRFGAKGYRTGTGRKSIWHRFPIGESRVMPQFYFPAAMLSGPVLERVQSCRVGFCDVTGQTNERSIIAAHIPAGVVCGNKVPTITFASGASADTPWLFLAVANSLPFDWLARRVLTTSVNYFLLRSLPLPPIEIGTECATRLADLARRLAAVDQSGRRLSEDELWQIATWRAEIDAHVLVSWGLGIDNLSLMLDDFPLLDRGQPTLPGERVPTVTKDLVLSWSARLTGRDWEDHRIRAARAMGAIAYVPSEYAMGGRDAKTAAGLDLLAGDLAR